jgi:predicted acetyltransferase
MGLEIVPVSEADHRAVGDLARFYIHDMAVYAGWACPADGLLQPGDWFATYWDAAAAARTWPPGWRGFAFLLRVDGQPGGFALVKRLSAAPRTHDMGEFFVARQHRRRGIGRRMATVLFHTLGGRWEVREIPANIPARRFWRRVIADYTGGTFTEARETFAAYGKREFIVQRFCCGGDRGRPPAA